jgi:hypothetical protein
MSAAAARSSFLFSAFSLCLQQQNLKNSAEYAIATVINNDIKEKKTLSVFVKFGEDRFSVR